VKKRAFLIIGLALFLATKVYSYDDGDFQIWNTDSEELKINKDSKLVFEEEFRWGGNATEFFYQHYDVGLFHNLEKWLNIGGGYRHVYELKKGKFEPENEPYVTANLLWDIEGLKLEDRSRLEYRHFDYQDDSWRYRNKATVKLPWKFTKLEFQPYFADEIFLEFDGFELTRNRFYSGMGFALTKNVKADIYYMLQSTKSSSIWTDANVVGTKFKFAF